MVARRLETSIQGIFDLPDAIRINKKQDRVRWYRVASGVAHVTVPASGIQRATIIGVTDHSNARTVTIPTDDILREGTIFVVKDEGGSAASYTITIATEDSQTIDGASTKTITAAYGVLRLYSNGTNLFSW